MRKSWTESEDEDEETYYKSVNLAERPNHKSKDARDERAWRDHDNLTVDFENWCLEKKWNSLNGYPTGKKGMRTNNGQL